MATAGSKASQKEGMQTTDQAFRSLVRASLLVRRIMQPYFARFGLSGSQWGVLRSLHRAELEGMRGVRLTDLGNRLLVRPPSVTAIVERLCRTGLIRREVAPTDLRAKLVTLTPAGRKLVKRVLRGHSAHIAAVMDILPPDEQKSLLRILTRLSDHLTELVERGGQDGGDGGIEDTDTTELNEAMRSVK